MPTVNLEDPEWGQVMAILSTAPWRDANPLLMKIGAQLQQQQASQPPQPQPIVRSGNASQEPGHAQ